MRKVAPQDAEKVKAEISKSRSESGDPQLRNAVKILIEQFEKYQPVLEELDQVRKIVAQKQQTSQQGPAGPVCEPGSAASGPASQIPAIIEFIRPFIQPADPFRDMAIKIMQANLDLTNAMKSAMMGKLMGKEAEAPGA